MNNNIIFTGTYNNPIKYTIGFSDRVLDNAVSAFYDNEYEVFQDILEDSIFDENGNDTLAYDDIERISEGLTNEECFELFKQYFKLCVTEAYERYVKGEKDDGEKSKKGRG